jgi:hypothetical protein
VATEGSTVSHSLRETAPRGFLQSSGVGVEDASLLRAVAGHSDCAKRLRYGWQFSNGGARVKRRREAHRVSIISLRLWPS